MPCATCDPACGTTLAHPFTLGEQKLSRAFISDRVSSYAAHPGAMLAALTILTVLVRAPFAFNTGADEAFYLDCGPAMVEWRTALCRHFRREAAAAVSSHGGVRGIFRPHACSLQGPRNRRRRADSAAAFTCSACAIWASSPAPRQPSSTPSRLCLWAAPFPRPRP